MEKDIEFIKNALSCYDKLTLNQQAQLLEHTRFSHYNANDPIHQGDFDCVGILLIKKGEVRVFMLSNEGKEVTLYRLFPNDICILSASCVIKNITFDVHIEASTDCDLYVIDSCFYESILENNIYVQNFTYKIALDRFSDVMWAMEQILFMGVDKRLAIFLLDEARQQKSDEITLSHEMIAKNMGSAREVVSRMLKYFVNEKMVEVNRKQIKLIDKKKLAKLTQ